jgi:glycosyltransferase involved in cell wall biosynthesis
MSDDYHAMIARMSRKDVLFVSGPGRESSRYRCDHQSEQLELAGISADIACFADLDARSAVDRYDCFVLYRLPWRRAVARFVAGARDRGARILADADDLVFDRDRTDLIAAVTRLPRRERRAYESAIERFGQTLAEVDGVVVSTDPLRREAERTNPSVTVAYNAVSEEMVALADQALAEREPRPRRGTTVAYLSGTPTHDRDFLEAADAVLWALDRYEDVQFIAGGFLSLDDRFDRFTDRVVRAEYRPWRELPELLAQIDLSLAPLERDNAFTAAKSCVKYLEAGLLGVPTVASARPDFRRVIEHGTNGFLAEDPDEWREALAALVESAELRARVGAAARDDVLERHTTRARASTARAAFGFGR